MDMSDDMLLNSQEEDTVVPNTYAASLTTFSTQIVKKSGLKSQYNLEAETVNSNNNMNQEFL